MLLSGVCFACSSCTWLQSIDTITTITTVQNYELQAQFVLNLAENAFNVIVPMIPVAGQVAYHKAVATANDSLTALNDAIAVAQAAGQTNINVAQLEQAVAVAVGALVMLVNQFEADASVDAGASARANFHMSFYDMNRAFATMKRIGHVK